VHVGVGGSTFLIGFIFSFFFCACMALYRIFVILDFLLPQNSSVVCQILHVMMLDCLNFVHISTIVYISDDFFLNSY